MNMTEEEAMAIWLQRNEEIGERVRRRDERRRLAAAEEQAASDNNPRGGEEPPPTSDTTTQANAAAASDDLDVSLRSQSASDDGSSGGGVGNFQHAASVTQSDAWRRAISRNVMGEYNPNNPDPSYHDAYHAYQRFVDMHKPGVADNFVPSTPGLASLMEQRRYLMARQGHLDSLVNHQATADGDEDVQQKQTSTSSSTAGITSSSSPQDSQEKNASTNIPDCCSIRQSLSCDDIIRRISEQDEAPSDQPSTSGSAPPTFPKKSSILSRSDNTALVAAASMRKLLNKSQEGGKLEDESSSRNEHAVMAQVAEESRSASRKRELGGGGDDASRRFFYAFLYPTQYNNKKVTCSGCLVEMYTNPLASNFFCQTCGTVTSVMDDKWDEEGDEAMWEEKMQDVEDMEF